MSAFDLLANHYLGGAMADKLTVEQIAVPDGMLTAALQATYPGMKAGLAHNILAAALLWLAENPLEVDDIIEDLRREWDSSVSQRVPLETYNQYMVGGVISRMFLKRPVPVPEEVKALLKEYGQRAAPVAGVMRWEDVQELATKLYELGKAAR